MRSNVFVRGDKTLKGDESLVVLQFYLMFDPVGEEYMY